MKKQDFKLNNQVKIIEGVMHILQKTTPTNTQTNMLPPRKHGGLEIIHFIMLQGKNISRGGDL